MTLSAVQRRALPQARMHLSKPICSFKENLVPGWKPWPNLDCCTGSQYIKIFCFHGGLKKKGASFGGVCSLLWDMEPYSQVSSSCSQPKVHKDLAWASKLQMKPANIGSCHLTKQVIFLTEVDWFGPVAQGMISFVFCLLWSWRAGNFLIQQWEKELKEETVAQEAEHGLCPSCAMSTAMPRCWLKAKGALGRCSWEGQRAAAEILPAEIWSEKPTACCSPRQLGIPCQENTSACWMSSFARWKIKVIRLKKLHEFHF